MDTFVNPTSNIGERLAEIRRQLRLNQLDFASKLDTSISAYKNYERGARTPPTELLVKLCTEFDADPARLLLGRSGAVNKKMIEAAVIFVEDHLSRQGKSSSAEKKAKAIAAIAQLLAQDASEPGAMHSIVELAYD